MAGYLDADFSGGLTGFRLVIQRVLATLEASDRRVYSFGNGIASVNAPSNQDVIRTLVRQEFYSDNDTRLEDVLDSVAADGTRQAVHLVVTDGRRGSGDAAIAQYQRMGGLARQWASDANSLFAVAVIDAPFVPVRKDRAGCWNDRRHDHEGREREVEGREPLRRRGRDADDEQERAGRCPLYVFVFAPRSASAGVLDRLRDSGARLYVTPSFSDASVSATQVSRTPPQPTSMLRAQGGSGDTPLQLYFETTAQQARVEVEIALDFAMSAGRLSLDDSLEVRLTSTGLSRAQGKPAAGSWNQVKDATTAWVRPGEPRIDGGKLRATLPITLVASPQIAPTRYRIELVSTGVPAWLGAFEASSQGHATRTYGLSALFDQLPRRATPIAVVVGTVYPSLQ